MIVDYKLSSDADKRQEDPYHHCFNCGVCIERCPVRTISFKDRHDKQKCSIYVMSITPHIIENYRINIYACGLCQVGVPCEKTIPSKKVE